MENKRASAPSMGVEEELARPRLMSEQDLLSEMPTGTYTAAERWWIGLRIMAGAAGYYAALWTRQGVLLFGEPSIGPIKTIVDRC